MVDLFVHIGGDTVVLAKEIVAIVKYEPDNLSDLLRQYLQMNRNQGFVEQIAEKPDSFVVTTTKVFLSPISAATLGKRAQEIDFGQ